MRNADLIRKDFAKDLDDSFFQKSILDRKKSSQRNHAEGNGANISRNKP